MRRLSAFGCLAVLACGETQPQPDASAPDSSIVKDAAADVADVMSAADAVDSSSAPDADASNNVDSGACAAYESLGPYGCNKLFPPSSVIPLACVSEPAATGGTIVDGYYELTGYEFDTHTFDASCPTGATHSGIVMFCSGTMLWFDIDQNSSSFDSTGTYTTSGNSITVSPLSNCDGNMDTYEYTATSTTFEIRGGSTITIVYRYTLK